MPGALWVGCTLALSVSACGPIVTPAAFRARPDAAGRGSSLGPFHGRVVDAATGRPVEQAQVLCSWSFVRGIGAVAPEAARTFSTASDLDGVYRIPELRALPGGLSTRLSRVTLIVFHPDYVGYRSDFQFTPRLRQRAFVQRAHVVRLTRWRSELSHARHLLFLGGGGRLHAALARARDGAGLELDQPALAAAARPATDAATEGPPTTPPAQPVLAALLLAVDDVRAVTGYQGILKRGPLADPGDATDTLHMQAEGEDEAHDVAVRLWRRSPDELVAKLEGLREELPGSRPLRGLGDRALTVTQGEIRAVAFLDAGHAALVLLTCGRAQCSSEAKLLALARRAAAQLSQLPAWSESAPQEPDTQPAGDP